MIENNRYVSNIKKNRTCVSAEPNRKWKIGGSASTDKTVVTKEKSTSFKILHGLKKYQKQTQLTAKNKEVDPRNRLNDLTSTEWVKFLRSWFVFDALQSDLEEERNVTKDCDQHPATFSPTMISDFIRFFTKKDMKVLDPFVGIGSTLVACDRTGREGYGIDINPDFVEIARKRTTERQTIILGNALDLDKMGLPRMDFCITSPPYWCMLHKIDVNQRRRIKKGLATRYSDRPDDLGNVTDYNVFMEKICTIFDKVYDLLRWGAYLVVITQNIIDGRTYVPFAWELALKLSSPPYRFKLKKEKIWCQAHKHLHPFGYPYAWVSNTHHHYCLVFRKEARKG